MKKLITFFILTVFTLLLCTGCAEHPIGTTAATTEHTVPETTAPVETTVPEEQIEPMEFGAMGMALRVSDHSLYWDYDTNTLINRDDAGIETPVLQHSSPRQFAVAGSRIFYNTSSTLCSVNFAGSSYTEWGEGTLLAVEDNGHHLICLRGGVLCAFDTREETWTELVSGGSFLAVHRGVVYYSPENSSDYDAARKGRVTLSAVNVDGTNDRVLCVTEPDLYDYVSGYSPASIMQIRFSDDAVYFSYGSIAGTGFFFQGGKVVRIGFDGSDVQVVAGEDRLVDADFVILEDGSVSTTAESYFIDYTSQLDFVVYKNILYWFEPLSGEPIQIAEEPEFDIGVTCDTWEVSFANVSDGYAFYRILYKVEDPENTVGWRTAYKTVASCMFMKNLETGETVVLGQSA